MVNELTYDRFVNIQALYLSHALLYSGFQDAGYKLYRTREEARIAFWIMAECMINMSGAIIERRFMFGDICEIAAVGRLLMSGLHISLYAIRVCAARVGGRMITFEPGIEKVLVVGAPAVMMHYIEPCPLLPLVLPNALVQQLQDNTRAYLEPLIPEQRVYPDYVLRIEPSHSRATRVTSPQESLLNYVEVLDAHLRPFAQRFLESCAIDESVAAVDDGVDTSTNFDLMNETLALEFPEQFASASLDDLVTAYIVKHYHPTLGESLPFGRNGDYSHTFERGEGTELA